MIRLAPCASKVKVFWNIKDMYLYVYISNDIVELLFTSKEQNQVINYFGIRL